MTTTAGSSGWSVDFGHTAGMDRDTRTCCRLILVFVIRYDKCTENKNTKEKKKYKI